MLTYTQKAAVADVFRSMTTEHLYSGGAFRRCSESIHWMRQVLKPDRVSCVYETVYTGTISRQDGQEIRAILALIRKRRGLARAVDPLTISLRARCLRRLDAARTSLLAAYRAAGYQHSESSWAGGQLV